jgi:hypothetical protein
MAGPSVSMSLMQHFYENCYAGKNIYFKKSEVTGE